MKISLVAAVSTNRVIGVGDDLPWSLPADMQFFRKTTMGHHMAMGRKTWEILGKPLPGRTSIVVSRNKVEMPEGVFVCPSMEDAVLLAANRGEAELMVIGGGKLYESAISMAHCIYLTHVYTRIKNGTAFFPPVSAREWKIVSSVARAKDDVNAFEMEFLTLQRKTSGT